jgi:hypothetical protein
MGMVIFTGRLEDATKTLHRNYKVADVQVSFTIACHRYCNATYKAETGIHDKLKNTTKHGLRRQLKQQNMPKFPIQVPALNLERPQVRLVKG